MLNPLLDKEFLAQLDEQREKEQWARIIALTVDEQPIEEITGKITSGGNISIDGSSCLRRTCSLSMVAEEVNINDYYWGLNTKFKLEIGLTNNLNKDYPDIIWFKKGVFVLTSFSVSHSTNNYTISLQGKDKMCLLNGDVGGSLTALSYDFGNIDYIDENNVVRREAIPIKDIIREGVHEYGQEPWHNIIINDLDDYGVELLDYRGSLPMYLFISTVDDNDVANMTFNSEQNIYINGEATTIKAAEESGSFIFDPLIDDGLDAGLNGEEPTKVTLSADEGAEVYTVAKIENGQTVGYRLTEIVYPGELIASAGESFTSVLDKIVTMLGDFEYFYDVDGRFIFQRKATFINQSWNNIIENPDQSYVDSAAYTSAITYYFEGNTLISSISNSPQLQNVKNDYAIWGKRRSASGAELDIHLRYAIDRKPVYYKNFNGEIFTPEVCDWREIIYQMALDYRRHNHEEDFLVNIRKNNILNNEYLYPSGYTGYEQYYIDMEGFWRQLYDGKNWKEEVKDSPETLYFWIDFLDSDSELAQYSVPLIGNRPKVINDNKVKAIYFRETPTVVFINKNDENEITERKAGYTYIQYTDAMKGLFNISSQGKSAIDELNSQLYKHGYCTESISLTTVPIHYLEPNTRIFVRDEESGIEGEYILTRMSVSLGQGSMMSLSATKAVKSIY